MVGVSNHKTTGQVVIVGQFSYQLNKININVFPSLKGSVLSIIASRQLNGSYRRLTYPSLLLIGYMTSCLSWIIRMNFHGPYVEYKVYVFMMFADINLV